MTPPRSRRRRRSRFRRLRSGPWWRRALRLIAFAARALFAQGSLLLRPTRRDLGVPGDVGLRHEEVRLDAGRGETLRGWWVAAEPCAVAVVLLPGAIGNISHDLAALRFLGRLGAAVLAVDYPGYGASSGRASEAGCYRAAEAAWRHVTEARGFSASQIVVYGRSMGAAIAAWLAARHAAAGLVLHAAFPSFPEVAALHLPRWLVALACRLRFDAAAHVARVHCPLLQIHGRGDTLLPVELARRVHARAGGPLRYLETTDGHFDDGWCYDPAVREAWLDLLRSVTAP